MNPDANAMRLDPIANQLLGSSGAQVTALVREARGLARAEQSPLNQQHLEIAAARICQALDPDLLWRVAVHEAGHIVVTQLGDRAAEQIVLGESLNGAGLGQNSDLEFATRLAGQMLFEWGFGERLVFTPSHTEDRTTTRCLDKVLKDAEQHALQILGSHRPLLNTVAKALCKKRELSGEQIRELLKAGE